MTDCGKKCDDMEALEDGYEHIRYRLSQSISKGLVIEKLHELFGHTLKYKGVIIDISGSKNFKLYDISKKKWIRNKIALSNSKTSQRLNDSASSSMIRVQNWVSS